MSSRMSQTSRAFEIRNEAQFSFEYVGEQRVISIRELWQQLRSEIKIAGGIEEYRTLFQYPISRVQGRLSALPFRFDSVECDLDRTINQLLWNSKSLDVDSPIKKIVVDICKLLIELLRIGDNPILPAIINSLDSESLVVIKDSYWKTSLQKFLKENTAFEPQVININRLAGASFHKKVIYLGSPALLAYRPFSEPDTRFLLDPKASINHFIMYPLGDLKNIPGIIDGSGVGRILNYSTPVVFKIEDFDQEPTEWSAISSRQSSTKIDTEISEPARFVGLAGGNHMWMSAKPDSRCRVLSLSRAGELEIEARQTSELREGEMIVERIGKSSPNLIDSVADGLGAKKFRTSQAIWKKALQNRIAEVGNVRAMERILESDFKVEVLNLRHWAFDPHSISPASQNDFVKTCDYLGLKESASKLWKELSEIRSLHIKAGNEISLRLQEAVMKLSLDQVRESDGMLLIEVKDCGSLGIFRVEHCSDEQVNLPISEIDVVTSNSEGI